MWNRGISRWRNVEPSCTVSRFSFSLSWRWHRSTRKGPYALCFVSQQTPQRRTRNSPNICLVEHRSFSTWWNVGHFLSPLLCLQLGDCLGGLVLRRLLLEPEIVTHWSCFSQPDHIKWLQNWCSCGYPARCHGLQCQYWDWLAWCPEYCNWVTDPQLLTQCGSTYNFLRPVPQIHLHDAGTSNNHQQHPATSSQPKLLSSTTSNIQPHPVSQSSFPQPPATSSHIQSAKAPFLNHQQHPATSSQPKLLSSTTSNIQPHPVSQSSFPQPPATSSHIQSAKAPFLNHQQHPATSSQPKLISSTTSHIQSAKAPFLNHQQHPATSSQPKLLSSTTSNIQPHPVSQSSFPQPPATSSHIQSAKAAFLKFTLATVSYNVYSTFHTGTSCCYMYSEWC